MEQDLIVCDEQKAMNPDLSSGPVTTGVGGLARSFWIFLLSRTPGSIFKKKAELEVQILGVSDKASTGKFCR